MQAYPLLILAYCSSEAWSKYRGIKNEVIRRPFTRPRKSTLRKQRLLKACSPSRATLSPVVSKIEQYAELGYGKLRGDARIEENPQAPQHCFVDESRHNSYRRVYPIHPVRQNGSTFTITGHAGETPSRLTSWFQPSRDGAFELCGDFVAAYRDRTPLSINRVTL
jgi:hypothetical protein